jgi:hypothetical protein
VSLINCFATTWKILGFLITLYPIAWVALDWDNLLRKCATSVENLGEKRPEGKGGWGSYNFSLFPELLC